MGSIEFRKFVRNRVEYRFDPLTYEQCRINPDRARRPKQVGESGEIREMLQKTQEVCPFCPGRVEEKTPLFAVGKWKGRRIERGETLIFPNVNPFAENHAVGVMSRSHFLNLGEFEPVMLRDNLLAARDYIFSIYDDNPQAYWPVYVWNYMPPSAGSIVHPHSQIFVESEPLPILAKTLDRCLAYSEATGRNFWKDLVQTEKEKGERFIYQNSHISLIASFAPRGFHEIHFIFEQASSLGEVDEAQVDSFALLLVKVLKAYGELGIGSFNLVVFSGPLNRKLENYQLNAKLISRPYPRGLYTNDTGPLERLCDAWVIDTVPESFAECIRRFFLSPGS